MKREPNLALQRLAWDRLWRILLAPPTEEELAPEQALRAEEAIDPPADDEHVDQSSS